MRTEMADTLYQAYEQYVADVATATREYRTSIHVLSETEFAEFVSRFTGTDRGERLLDQIRHGFRESCLQTRERFKNAIDRRHNRKAA